MANINKIKLPDVETPYNIEDTTARSGLTTLQRTVGELQPAVAQNTSDVADLKSAIGLESVHTNNAYNDTAYGSKSTDWINATVLNAQTPAATAITASTTRLLTTAIYPIAKNTIVNITTPNGYKHRVLFAKNYTGQTYIGQTGLTFDTTTYDDAYNWFTTDRTLIAPECMGFCLLLAKTDDSNISSSDIPEDFSAVVASVNSMGKEIFITPDELVTNYGYYKKDNIPLVFSQGNWKVADGIIIESTTRCHTDRIPIEEEKVYLSIPNSMKGRMNFFNANNICIDTTSTRTWTIGAFEYTIPSNAVTVGISVAYINDTTITPSDCTGITMFCYRGNLSHDAVKTFAGKKISILGDSISTYAGANAQTAGDGHSIADGTYTYAGNHCRYPNAYLSNVNDTYWKKLIDALGMTLDINDSWAGSRVSWDGTEGSDTGADIYIASPTRIGHLDDNGTPDIILVNAGTNDIGLAVTVGTFNTENPVSYTDEQIAALPVATFAAAYRALLIRLQKAYPLARIVVMLPDYTTSYYNPTQADQYLEIIKEACDYFGVPWVDMRTTGITMYNTGTYTGDGIHPNVEGMTLLYEKVKKFFLYSM